MLFKREFWRLAVVQYWGHPMRQRLLVGLTGWEYGWRWTGVHGDGRHPGPNDIA